MSVQGKWVVRVAAAFIWLCGLGATATAATAWAQEKPKQDEAQQEGLEQEGWEQEGWEQEEQEGWEQDGPAGDGSAEDGPAEDGPEQDDGGDAAEAPHALTAWLTPGLGATQRVVEFDSIAGLRELDTALVPAFELALRGSVADAGFLFDVALSYQTSLFSTAEQSAPVSVGSSTPIRSHRFEGGFAPGVRFGSDEDSVSLHAFVGYVLRAFSSEEELLIPRFTLHGPALRLELGIPIAGIVQLRLAPEVQGIAALSKALQDAGSLESQGWSVGGEAGLRARILQWLWLGASYRESHARVGSALRTPLSDAERFLFGEVWIRYY